MKTVCSWCGHIIAHGTDASTSITHGMCPTCSTELLAELNVIQPVAVVRLPQHPERQHESSEV